MSTGELEVNCMLAKIGPGALAFLWVWSVLALSISLVLIRGLFGLKKLLVESKFGQNGIRADGDPSEIERRGFVVSLIGFLLGLFGVIALALAIAASV